MIINEKGMRAEFLRGMGYHALPLLEGCRGDTFGQDCGQPGAPLVSCSCRWDATSHGGLHPARTARRAIAILSSLAR